MRILALIPARGGSKSIPRKNVAPLLGRPLLAYTCDAALGSRAVDRVVLSTDDEEIAEVGRACGVEVPFLRPAELATDDTPALPVIRHALAWLEDRDGYGPDAVVLLQPTSPLRRAEHVDEAAARFAASRADTLVSVVAVPHQFTLPSLMVMRDDGTLGTLNETGRQVLRRQDKPVVYARNGPAVLIVSRRTVLSEKTLYGPRVVPYVMEHRDSVDIDTPLDCEWAEFLLRRC